MSLFSEFAPRYWAANLPAIPLWSRKKNPKPDGWQAFCANMPTQDHIVPWLAEDLRGANYNLGLTLGPASGLVAIDLDTDDPKIRRLVEELLPPTPWVRRGRKGAIFIYRWNEHRTFQVKDAHGQMIVECLSKGRQMVLPPSIHPDTGVAYEANSNLWQVLSDIRPLTTDIETILRQGLISIGVELGSGGALKSTEWVAAGARDNSMVALAGLLARDVLKGHRTLQESFDEMSTWAKNYVATVAGDPLDVGKGHQRIVDFIRRDIAEKNRGLPKGWDEGLLAPKGATENPVVQELSDNEEWDASRIIDYLQDCFKQFDRGSKERRSRVEEVLLRIARSPGLSVVDREEVFQYISQTSGRTLTVTSLRKRVDELTSGGVEGTDHTEIAKKLVEEFQRFGPIRYYGDQLYQWKGSHWGKIEEVRVMETIANEFGDLPAAKRHSDHSGIRKVACALAAGPLKTLDVIGLNFANGFVTEDLVLREHAPEFGATYTLPYLYHAPDESISPQMWLSFLHSCWGQDPDYADKVQALREAIAVTLFGLAPEYQRAICAFGVPHSGKSVLIDIVLGLVTPDMTSVVRPHDWADKFLPTQMMGKLINFCGELSENELIPGDRFKQIIDGHELDGQYKGRDIFKFRPRCAHWFSSNHLPRSRDSSAGFTRRWLFLTFARAVPAAERIQGLAAKILAEEREMIVAWAVACMPRLKAQNGYTLPASHRGLADSMAVLNNSVRHFLLAGGVTIGSPPASSRSPKSTTASDLHTAYWSFCKTEARAQPVSLVTFVIRMQELAEEMGFKVLRSRVEGAELVSFESITLATGSGARL